MTTDEAITAIRNAASLSEASGIRNDVATEAMRKLRPQSDATACDKVFWEVWSGAVLESHRQVPKQAPLYFTGD